MPILNALKESVIDYNIGSLDATTLQVLNEPDRKATTKSYVYCFRGGGPGKESIIYEYNEKEHKKFVKDWFEGFSGAVHSDADSFFNGLYAREDVWPLLCNSHSRRKYEAITKTSLQEGLAHEAMCFYSQLYNTRKRLKGVIIAMSK
jgi:transposase